MPPKRTPVKSVSDKRVEPTSARKTRAQLAAETNDSEEICPDNSVKDAGAMEEGNQIPSDPGPSGWRAGQSGVGAQTGVTRDAATAHLVSDNQESEDTSGVGPSKRSRKSPRKKGKFDQKEPDDTDSDRSRSGGQKLSTAGERTFRLMYRRLMWGMMMRGMSSDHRSCWVQILGGPPTLSAKKSRPPHHFGQPNLT
jgi:hypothetical protein